MAESSGAAVGGRFPARTGGSSLFALGGAAAGGASAPGLTGLASFTMTSGGEIVSWTAAAGQLFGLTPQQAVGRRVTELLAPGHEDTLAGALAAAGAGDAWSGSVAVAGPGGRQAVAFRWDPVHGGRQPHVAVVARAVVPAGPDLLAEADRLLGATLDLTETARQVLGLAVPRLADAGAVYLLEPLLTAGRASRSDTAGEAVVRRLAVYAADGAHRRWADALPDGEVIVFHQDTPGARCVARGRPVLFSEPDAGMEERLARTGEGQELISRYASFLAAPLAARGEVAGLLLLARTAGAPAFGPLELAAAEGLAARAGICVDNARLFTQERRTAEALQRGLLPREMAAPAGLDVAHRYRPAGDHAIGGDWYDVIPLPEGRATVTVGDAMGHGPEAAAVMAQLRAATHVLADLDLPPAELLRRLNRMAKTVTEGTFATCVCATVDPARGSCVLARAGHLPPIVALPGGPCDVIDLPSGLPLGLGDMEFHAAEVALPPGAVLALYTDGLVESRARTFDVGIQALRSALRGVRGPLPAACDSIVGELCQHGEDDTTLVLVRMPGGAPA